MASHGGCWKGLREVSRGPREDSWGGFPGMTSWEGLLKWATPPVLVGCCLVKSYQTMCPILRFCPFLTYVSEGNKIITWVSGNPVWDNKMRLYSSEMFTGVKDGVMFVWGSLCCDWCPQMLRKWTQIILPVLFMPSTFTELVAVHPELFSILYTWGGRGWTFSLALIMVSN